jgi:hypothetical protein
MVAFLNFPLAIVLVCIVGMLSAVGVWELMGWLNRRDRRRWEVQEQLREMEQAIWRDTLPDELREQMEAADRKRAAIRGEARRRLGLPEEE